MTDLDVVEAEAALEMLARACSVSETNLDWPAAINALDGLAVRVRETEARLEAAERELAEEVTAADEVAREWMKAALVDEERLREAARYIDAALEGYPNDGDLLAARAVLVGGDAAPHVRASNDSPYTVIDGECGFPECSCHGRVGGDAADE